ncbi:hypothetical protein PQO01_01315 [Lentisphaera marina]|uniref:hypothetical protein n=1 Tax=Lentisphaera marina TaxID=1111041 RepID=UPI002365511C|nr:hypothetical protein [Lentisphaera marina]MDD7983587.1 hypothetical protein [Lentisphaera marina]
MNKLISLCLLLSFTVLAESKNELNCYISPTEEFALVEIKQANYYGKVAIRPNKKHPLLYPVFIKNGKEIHCLALSRKEFIPNVKEDFPWSLTQNPKNNKQNRQKITDKQQYEKIHQIWQEQFRNNLNSRAKLYEDSELEYLLHLKFFKTPITGSYKSWKNDKLSNLIWSFSGLQDIRYAIPLNKTTPLKNHEYTELPPKAISLPQVNNNVPEAKAEQYPLACLTPRSCYYWEFSSLEEMKQLIQQSSDLFNQWSPGTYPKTFQQALDQIFKDMNIQLDTLKSEEHGRIAIAGWDPFFQSGTSLLIISEKAPLSDNQAFSFSSNWGHATSNSLKLLNMAKSAFLKKKSLYHDSNFIHARAKIPKDETERLYFYLSDYCLSNFLSPRWQILNKRLIQCDARIRLATLLRLVEKKEQGLKELPSLNALEEQYKNHPQITYLLKDLILDKRNDSIVHRELGGLYQHPAIDQIKFDKVSPVEKKFYDNFAQMYMRNWRAMDPIAWQLNQEKNTFKSRLYISPISRLSDFREISQVVLAEKQKHQLREIPQTAAGISLIFQTQLMAPFVRKKIPQQIQVSARSYDFAPRVNSLQAIHKKDTGLDPWSYIRTPALIEIPTLIAQLGLTMSNSQIQDCEYKGLRELNLRSNDWLHRIFTHTGDQGYTRVSLHPSILQNATTQMGELKETTIPSDIYAYLDFKKAYLMHRFLLIEAAKNRIYAHWRRHQRLRWIEQQLGNDFVQKNLFPLPQQAYKGAYFNLPEPDSDFKSYYRSIGPSSYTKHLPPVLKRLDKLEQFISVEPNALFFETHLKLKDKPAATKPLQAPAVVNPQNAQSDGVLDFDSE